MAFTVITNPGFQTKMGFTQAQFKKLDDLYCQAASIKALNFRTVECDFEEGIASYTYYKTKDHPPYARFVMRKAGPKEMMYEVYREGGGLVAKSPVFDRAYEKIQSDIKDLIG